MGITSSKTKLTNTSSTMQGSVWKSVAQIYVVRDNGIMPINQGLEEPSKEMFLKKPHSWYLME